MRKCVLKYLNRNKKPPELVCKGGLESNNSKNHMLCDGKVNSL